MILAELDQARPQTQRHPARRGERGNVRPGDLRRRPAGVRPDRPQVAQAPAGRRGPDLERHDRPGRLRPELLAAVVVACGRGGGRVRGCARRAPIR